jgi:hypothetical protein
VTELVALVIISSDRSDVFVFNFHREFLLCGSEKSGSWLIVHGVFSTIKLFMIVSLDREAYIFRNLKEDTYLICEMFASDYRSLISALLSILAKQGDAFSRVG